MAINEDHPNEKEQGLFIQSLLQQGSQLAFAVGKGKAPGMPCWVLLAWAGCRWGVLREWLGVHTGLSLLLLSWMWGQKLGYSAEVFFSRQARTLIAKSLGGGYIKGQMKSH